MRVSVGVSDVAKSSHEQNLEDLVKQIDMAAWPNKLAAKVRVRSKGWYGQRQGKGR